MDINYIKNVTTLEELKKEYKRLAMIHHPDRGGDTAVMQIINNEYDYLFEKLKHIHKNRHGEFYENKKTEETPEEWKDILSDLFNLKMKNVDIEIIGKFIWVTGETKPYKKHLGKDGLKFSWSKNKSAWYKSPYGYRKQSHKVFELDDIRNMYGSTTVNTNKQQKKQLVNAK